MSASRAERIKQLLAQRRMKEDLNDDVQYKKKTLLKQSAALYQA